MLLDDTWPTRLEQERRLGNLSLGEARVLHELWRLIIVGDCEPSEARLCDLAGVSRSTVGRAKARGRTLGIMGWERQRVPGASIRQERPCLYRLETPPAPPTRRVRQKAERQASLSKERQLALLPVPPQDMTALIATRQARLNAEWLAMRQARLLAGVQLRV